MNNWEYGPCPIFGPTLDVNVSALHHAETETLKFSASRPILSPASLRDHAGWRRRRSLMSAKL
jgi:hypothetical protein